jgi:hypothetical protein
VVANLYDLLLLLGVVVVVVVGLMLTEGLGVMRSC